MKRRTIFGLIAAAVLASCTGGSTPSVDAGSTVGADQNWPDVAAAADESGFSRLTEITTDNIDKLGLAWSMDLDGETTLEGTPLAVDGVVYFTGSFAAVYAVDGQTGKLLWKYDPEVWKTRPDKMHYTFGANRGAAYANGKIFAAALNGELFALDAKTGKLVWSVDTIPEGYLNIVTGAPRVFKDKVIIGNGGADFNARGFVTAFDQATGKQAWRFFTAPGSPEENKGDPVMEKAAATWSGEYWKTGTGGTAWNGMTFDPELNRIYIGTGNGGPFNVHVRSPGNGDNLFLCSIVALDADTGKYIWHYQMNPREAWDYKATANMISTKLTIDGKPRKVLMQSPTNGFFYVIDRETGKLISAEKTGKVTWADGIDLKTGRPIEKPNIRYETGDTYMFPSVIGAHNWQAMSFSPKTGLVYIPHMQLGSHFTTNVPPGEFAFGGMTTFLHVDKNDPEDGKGYLLAWDPVAQKARWKVPHETIWNGGTLATAGGVVFQGTGDGYFTAYDAANGKQLWRFNAGLGIVGAPMSYAVNGKQYVSVLVGYGGTTAALSTFLDVGWKYGQQPRRILTFALDGKATIPPSPPRDMKVHAVDDPKLVLNEADVQAGRAISVRCLACHGQNLHAAGTPAPDLRESQMSLSVDDLWSVLHDGVLIERGMPRFEDLTKEQVRQLHAYIRAKARESLGLRKAQGEPEGSSRM